MADISFGPAAEAEYEAAVAWYRVHYPHGGPKFERLTQRALGLLGSFPETFAFCDDYYRLCPISGSPYSLIYYFETGTVRIVAVSHERQDPGYWAGRA